MTNTQTYTLQHKNLEYTFPKLIYQLTQNHQGPHIGYVINGPGGFTNLRIGALTLNLFNMLGSTTIDLLSIDKKTLYTKLADQGVLPDDLIITIGQRKNIRHLSKTNNTISTITKDDLALHNTTHYAFDFCGEDQRSAGSSMITFSLINDRVILHRHTTQHDITDFFVPTYHNTLTAEYMIQPTITLKKKLPPHDLQDQIHAIMISSQPKQLKFQQLHDCLSQYDIVFTDLDDTISTNYQFFFLKYFFYRLIMRKKHYDIFPELMNNFIINPNFIDLIKQHNITKPLFIISRNQYDFVKFFVEQSQPLRQQHGISLVGGVGSILGKPPTIIFSRDKQKIMPKNALFISDIFEYHNYRDYPGFLCVDPTPTHIDVIKRKIQKLRNFGIFCIQTLFKNKK